MATTMRLIGKQTLGADTASVSFSDIPGTYTDLVIACSARTDRTGATADIIKARFNGNTNDNNMSNRYLYGAGSAAASGTLSVFVAGIATSNSDTASTFGNSECVIPNYAGSTNKSGSETGVNENNSATANYVEVSASLWSSTAAITSITLLPYFGSNFKSGSSFFLYGITKA